MLMEMYYQILKVYNCNIQWGLKTSVKGCGDEERIEALRKGNGS